MKRKFWGIVVLLFILSFTSAAFADEDPSDDTTPLQGLDRVESVLYGAPLSGGLLLRLSKVERDLFGMELPGSLTERQQALQTFVEDGNASQPSLLFKIGVAEWVTLRRVNPSMPFGERVASLERTLEGDVQEGAWSVRLERLITKLLPGGVTATDVQVPAATVFRAKFVNTLTVRNVKKGDKVHLELEEDCIINGILASAKGNRLVAEVTKVKMPRSFGRPSEIEVSFNHAESLGCKLMAVVVGPEAKKAMEIDSGTIGAVGASVGGAILLGPVGLAGGFLVRGSDKKIPEGTKVYVETSEYSNLQGYQIPNIMNSVGDAENSGS